jgi:hypothetical protein
MTIAPENIETIKADLEKQIGDMARYIGMSPEDLGDLKVDATIHEFTSQLDLELAHKVDLVPAIAGETIYRDKDTAAAVLGRKAEEINASDWHDRPSAKFLPKLASTHVSDHCTNGANFQHPCDDCNARGKTDCNRCNTHGRLRCNNCDKDGEIPCYHCRSTGIQTCYACSGSGTRMVWEEKRGANGYTTGNMVPVRCNGGCGGTGKVGPCHWCRGRTYITCPSCRGALYFTCSPCGGAGYIDCGRCNATGTAVSGLAMTTALKTTPNIDFGDSDVLKLYAQDHRNDLFKQPDFKESRTELSKPEPMRAQAKYSLSALTAEAELVSNDAAKGHQKITLEKAGRHVPASVPWALSNKLWKHFSRPVLEQDFDALGRTQAGRDILSCLMASLSQRKKSAEWQRLLEVFDHHIGDPFESLAQHAEDHIRKGDGKRAIWLFLLVALAGGLVQFGPGIMFAYEKLGPYGLTTLNQYTAFLAISAWLLTVVHIDRKRKRRLKRLEVFTGSTEGGTGRTPLRPWRTILASALVFVGSSAIVPAYTAMQSCEYPGASGWAECTVEYTMSPYQFWKHGFEHGLHGDLSLIVPVRATSQPDQ